MFDEDPGSVKQGEAHWIMGYMKAWRPTFIYVSLFAASIDIFVSFVKSRKSSSRSSSNGVCLSQEL